MIINLAPELSAFLHTQGYIIMFITMVLEGPIVTYSSAFAASLGVFNIYIILLLSGFGNVVGDIVLYSIGKYGGRGILRRHFDKSMNKSKMHKLQEHMLKHPGKTIMLIKLTPIICVPGLVMAGAMDVPWKKFLLYSVIVSFTYSAIFTILGFYSGVAFGKIITYVKYSEFIIAGAIVVAILIWLGVRYAAKSIAKKIDDT
jgi:membrane protein DedA with SNARE-associated domain